jgi:seryl-tRNA synthetase
MTQPLSIVPSDNENALVRARRYLGKRQKDRADAQAALEQAVAQHRRVEKLMPNRQAITEKIQTLEKSQAVQIEQWAIAGEGDSPKLPHVAEIEELKKQLSDADIKAAGTKAALDRMIETIRAYQEDNARCIDQIRDAADRVLVELASEIAEELDPLEHRAALLRASLIALQRYFEMEGQRGRRVGDLGSVIARMIPSGPFQVAPQSIEAIAHKWNAFSGRLFNDNKATMEIKPQ